MKGRKCFDAEARLRYAEEDLAVAGLLYKHGFHQCSDLSILTKKNRDISKGISKHKRLK